MRLTIPMPGHTVGEKGEEEGQRERERERERERDEKRERRSERALTSDEKEVRASVERLEELVATNDVVFLALDSREARWLPTVLANKHRKVGEGFWAAFYFLG